MRVLAAGAHPDDAELWCGGTLAKYAARGDHVTIAYVTDGQMGSATLPPEEISAIRKKEARAACDVIGAEMIWLGYKDEFFFYNEESRVAFINLIRQVQPDVMFTHYPDYFSPDHSYIGKMLNDSCVMTTMPNVKTKFPPCQHIPNLHFWEAQAGIDFVPDEFVDITDTIETKRRMVACHASQGDWLKFQHDVSYLELVDIIARFRGLQANVKYAEAFRMVRKPMQGNLTTPLLP